MKQFISWVRSIQKCHFPYIGSYIHKDGDIEYDAEIEAAGWLKWRSASGVMRS